MTNSSPPPPSPPPTATADGDLQVGAAVGAAPGASPLSKRQRRPSVRLGDPSAATSLDPNLNPHTRRLTSSKTKPLSTLQHPAVPPRRSRSHRPPTSLGDADPRSNGHDRRESPPNSDEIDGWDDRRDGVRSWLDRLGLGRYAPVFEIHEVDDEVLPLLTLEDLKEMGIDAVGSRRKMYTEIQKLRRSSGSNSDGFWCD